MTQTPPTPTVAPTMPASSLAALPPLSTVPHPTDVWSYISAMSHMPSRADRDKLVTEARLDPRAARRVRIWDFFFRVDPDLIGGPQRAEIESCRSALGQLMQAMTEELARVAQRIEDQRNAAERVFNQELRLFGISAAAGSGVSIILLLIILLTRLPVSMGDVRFVALIVAFMMVVFFVFFNLTRALLALIRRDSTFDALSESGRTEERGVRTQFVERQSAYQQRIRQLDEQIAQLRRQIPTPPSHEEVLAWLQEDVHDLRRRSSLRSELPRLEGNRLNPLPVLAPAELQNDIPPPFLQLHSDRERHLTARRLVTLADGTPEVIYGVYSFEFVLASTDVLSAYRCYFDFITGRITGELTSEHYSAHISAISTGREYRRITAADGALLDLENEPTLTLSMSDGESHKVRFASAAYLESVRNHLGKQNVTDQELRQWLQKSEGLVDQAYTVLRNELRARRRTLN